MKAVIPTGGRGTRMRPLTFSANKHFIPVANKPLIFYPIETVAAAGITEIAITYDLLYEEQVKKTLGDGSRWGVSFEYVLQENPLGLANIFQVCEDFINGESFVLHLGDNIFVEGIDKYIEHFEKEKPDGLVPIVHHKENRRMGVPYFDENGRLEKYVEKPDNPPHDFAIPGLYFFSSEVFKCFREDPIQPSPRGELEISAPFQWLIDHKYRVDVLEYDGEWLDPGKFDDWITTNQYILDAKLEAKRESKPDESSTVENRVSIGKNCTITKSHIRGPLIIGDNVTITESYLGPYTSVSDGCEIEASHIENSVLMNNVKIKKISQSIDTSIIGRDCEITARSGPAHGIKIFIGEKSTIEM